MNKYLTCITVLLLPSPLARFLLKTFGAKIGKEVKFGFFTLLFVSPRNLVLENKVKLRGFLYIKSSKILIERNSVIGFFNKINVNNLHVGNNSETNSNVTIVGDKFSLGNFSKIFEYCFLECGESIKIGNHVGIGGHTLMFNHGSWSNFVEGGPVSFGSIEIEDNVWLPWRVFIMPGVKIGEFSIIGAGSLVTKSIPSRMLAYGNPAKIVKSNINNLTNEIKLKNLNYLVNLFLEKFQNFLIDVDVFNSKSDFVIIFDSVTNDLIDFCHKNKISHLVYNQNIAVIYNKLDICTLFQKFMSLYGVRFELVYIKK